MKTKTTLVTFLVLLMVSGVNAQKSETTRIEGKYTGKNLLVKNYFGTGGVGYCVNEVRVNGKTTQDKINADLFQVSLTSCGLKIGDPVKVELICKQGCTPKNHPMVMNPGAIENNGLVYEGKFKWQNIFISNANGVKEVSVNGKHINTDTKNGILEIDLLSLGLNDGDNVKLEVKFTSGNDPVLINPEALN